MTNKTELTIEAKSFIKDYPEVINEIVKHFEEEVYKNIEDYPDMLEENIRDKTANIISESIFKLDLQI